MKLLVIEDNEKHLQDVKDLMAKQTDLKVDFATTFMEARDLMDTNQYDAVITDVFFPWDDAESSHFPKGWNDVGRIKCWNLLESELNGFSRSDEYCRKVLRASEKWNEGYAMHPTGVIIVDMCLKREIDIVMCTDTYHHGYVSEPINHFAGSKKVALIDVYSEIEGDKYTGSAKSKNWKAALEALGVEVK